MNDPESDFARNLQRWSRQLAPSSASTARDRVLDRLPKYPSGAPQWRGIVLVSAAAVLVATIVLVVPAGWWSRPQSLDSSVAESPTALELPSDEKSPSLITDRPASTLVVVTLSSGTEVYIALGSAQPST